MVQMKNYCTNQHHTKRHIMNWFLMFLIAIDAADFNTNEDSSW